jgi:hypothetical protein
VQHDDANACRGQQQRQPLKAMNPVACQPHRQANGKKHLYLDYQRGNAWRDVPVHRQVQQPELAHTDQHAIKRQVLPLDRRARQEEQRRHQRQRKTQGGKQERRQVPQRHFDHHKVGAPDGDHRQRQ